MDKIKLASLRQDYRLKSLDVSQVNVDPFKQFDTWFHEALMSEISEPNAMILATVDTSGNPSARVVLLKAADSNGFVFFTNYTSKKGIELDATGKAALVFNWLDLQRQVRIEGTSEQCTREQSEQYFASRPKGSQIGAWASNQSEVIEDRIKLEEEQKRLTKYYAEADVLPCPPNWGGYLIKPTSIEFWQGRESRLHDRIRYSKVDGAWRIERLAP